MAVNITSDEVAEFAQLQGTGKPLRKELHDKLVEAGMIDEDIQYALLSEKDQLIVRAEQAKLTGNKTELESLHRRAQEIGIGPMIDALKPERRSPSTQQLTALRSPDGKGGA
jgi:hypothetical protein